MSHFINNIRVVLAASALLAAVYSAACAEDRIAAVVNKDVITEKDLRDFTSFMRMQLSQSSDDDQLSRQIETMQKGLLDRMVEDKLLLQDAAAAGVAVDQKRVRARIREIRKKYDSTAAFQEDLFRHGMSQGDIEKRMREQLMLQAVIDKRVRDKIVVGPDEVTRYYREHLALFAQAAAREVDIITAESEDIARSAARDVRQGSLLDAVASRYGVSVNTLRAARGGDLSPEIESRIFSLNVGQVSEPEAFGGRFYVFRVNAELPASTRPLADVQAEIRDTLYQQKMKQAMQDWIESLKKNAYIKIL